MMKEEIACVSIAFAPSDFPNPDKYSMTMVINSIELLLGSSLKK